MTFSQACEPRYQWLGPFYHRSRETDRLRRAAVSWWFTKPEDLSFLFDPGSVPPVVGEAPGPKVDLDEASDEQLSNLAAIAEIVDDSEEAGAGGADSGCRGRLGDRRGQAYRPRRQSPGAVKGQGLDVAICG